MKISYMRNILKKRFNHNHNHYQNHKHYTFITIIIVIVIGIFSKELEETVLHIEEGYQGVVLFPK